MKKEYNEEYCWQYHIRQKNLNEDLKVAGISQDELVSLRVSDFDLKFEDKNTVWKEAKEFIERHEWLGKMGLYPTYIYTARYKGILCGVLSFDMPNAFSKMLGDETKKMERLIGRGACISWSPKNLASKMINSSIKELVKMTPYRLFTAYSDPEAKELGTVYQACNFYYLGQKSGALYQYKIRDDKWVSDRYFRSRSFYKKIAIENNIDWNKEWQDGDKVKFSLMPHEISEKIKRISKDRMNSCEKRRLISKHKYAYVQGINKKETKRLRKIFEDRNKIYEYPKDR
jgi:hypothetical protein